MNVATKFPPGPTHRIPGKLLCKPFAWMEGMLIIATIAQKWTMNLTKDQRIKLDPAITLRPKYGMKMKLTLREKRLDRH